jgi:hypothetical protein
MDSKSLPRIAALISGALSAFVMLQASSSSSDDSWLGIVLYESIFFVVAAVVGCLFMRKKPFEAVTWLLPGVALGVLMDVVFHPNTAEGYERNLFPIEIAIHTIFAVPSVFLVAIMFSLVKGGHKNA